MLNADRRLLLVLLLVVSSPLLLEAQSGDLVSDLNEARRIYVPVEDLDVIIERDKQGVILPRAKFDVLLTQARANSEKNAVPAATSLILTSADYKAQISGDQLLITVTADLMQFENDWIESRFAFQRLSLEQALVDDVPAMIGRNSDGSISLFTDTRGKHSVKLQMVTELSSLGSDQIAAFPLLQAPGGAFTLTLPAGKRLFIGNIQLERPAPLDVAAEYQIPVGGTAGLQLRITDRATENAADSLMFASTGYGLHVTPGEVTWHALTSLQIFGKPVERLSFSVPRRLEISDVSATGLEDWELLDDPEDAQRTNLTLTFGQAFEGSRKISFKGVMAADPGDSWMVPSLRIDNVSSHVGHLRIQHPTGVRVRVEATAGIRRTTASESSSVDTPGTTSAETLRFDIWEPDFLLQMSTQPKERAVQAAVATVLDVNATGLELQAALTVQTQFAPLFELDIQVPAEWQVLSVTRENQALKWQLDSLDEVGTNQLRILLDPPVAAGSSSQIRLSLRHEPEIWPVEAQPVTISLPELYLPQSSLSEGAFVVRGDVDLELEASEVNGLDPVPLREEYERLRFQSQDTRFSGKLKITRRPSRVATQTVTFGRIDPQTFHAFIQSLVEVQGGGVRTLKVAVSESAGTTLRFECTGPRIVEQTSLPPQDDERVWLLKFDQRLTGQAVLKCDIELPRGDARSFVLPQFRFIDAERQTHFYAIEAGGEQRLSVVATDSDNQPLAVVDPLVLPPVQYQPRERIVEVYRSPVPGALLTLAEQRFEKIPVMTAICPLLDIATILGGTGELQHRATFHLNVVGVQGLHVTLPIDTQLWAALLDGQPVEVRRSGDIYLIPLTAATSLAAKTLPASGATRQHVLQLFYRSAVGGDSRSGKLSQNPPLLTVESGQRTALSVEVLEQKWTLYYPQETRVIESKSPLEPSQPLDRTSLLANWASELKAPEPGRLGIRIFIVLLTIGIVALINSGMKKQGLLATIAKVGLLVTVCAILFVVLAMPLSRARSRVGIPQLTSGEKSELASDKLVPKPVRHMDDSVVHPQDAFLGMYDEAEHVKRQFNAAEFPPAPPQAAPEHAPALSQAGPPQPERDGNLPAASKTPTASGTRGTARFALLSLAMDFVPPAGSHQKSFRYTGAETALSGIPLIVDYVDRRSLGSFRLFLVALLATSAWILRGTSLNLKLRLLAICLALPLAALPLAPMSWQGAIDGLVIGSIVSAVIWILCGSLRWLRTRLLPRSVAGLALVLLTMGASDAVRADDVSSPASPATLIVPFDAGTEPLASERVFLSYEQFRQLYRLANPDQVLKNAAPQPGAVIEALYAAKVVQNEEQSAESVARVTARYVVKSFVDGQFLVDLPLGKTVAVEATLDGQATALITDGGALKVAIPKPGLHVVDLVFEVPAKISGNTGSFVLPLIPVPSGKLAFELPGENLSVRVNGSSTIFRLVNQDDRNVMELPIDKGGELAISWQPQQAQGTASAVVHVDSVEAMTISDAGVHLGYGFAIRVRQGGIADTTFDLPESLKLQAVNGPDVGGWEIQGDGDNRKLRVIFRRNVTDQTQVSIETFFNRKVDVAAVSISVPQVVPRDATNEIGQIAVFAGEQFTVRAEQVEALTQTDGGKFSTPIPVKRPESQPLLAYRFSKRPFQLVLRATRQEPQVHVTSQQGALVTLRKQHLTTRFLYQLTGAPLSSLSVALPENFVLLDVQATELRDYYVTKEDEEATLTIELNKPMLGRVELVMTGFVPRDDVAVASIVFPQPIEPTRLDTSVAVWLDEGFAGTLDSLEGWRSTDASAVSGELRAVRPGKTAQFAFTSSSTQPSPISLSTVQSVPKITANGLTMVTVTDVAVVYLLALQWQIDASRVDTLTLTTPDWLAGKLEFQGPNVRDTTFSDAGEKTTRWTVHLRTPQSGSIFITATATLPPVTGELSAPALVFEHSQRPVDRQRQYVLLINSSLSQLSSLNPSLTEPVQRDELPVVVNQEFINQATELVRVKELKTAPSWGLNRFAQQVIAPASVNVADLTTVLSRDGTYRAQAIYTMKNHTRQFLAIVLPERTELLSVFVAGQPARAVTTKLDSLRGESVQLIALPKTSAVDLSFPVKIVWRGSLGKELPKAARLTREELSIPAPRILSQNDDPEFGIPVARTRWTVYLPEDLEAKPLASALLHNLNVSDDSENLYGNAVLQEAGELLGYFEKIRESNSRVQTRDNLRQIGVAANNLKVLGRALSSYTDTEGDSSFSRNKADVLKRLSEIDRLATEEAKKTDAYFTAAANSGLQKGGNSFQAEGLAEGVAIANGQQNALILSNTISGHGDGSQLGDDRISFGLSVKGESVADSKSLEASQKSSAGHPVQGVEAGDLRSRLRMSNEANITELHSHVLKNRAQESNQQSQAGVSSNAITGPTNGSVLPQSATPAGQSDFSGSGASPQGGMMGGFRENRTLWNYDRATGTDGEPLPGGAGMMGGGLSRFDSDTGNEPEQRLFGRRPIGGDVPPKAAEEMPPWGLANQMPIDGRKQGGQDGVNQPGSALPAVRQGAGLSLDINLPVAGRKLVFSKSGGDAKLGLAVHSRQSLQWVAGVVWALVCLASLVAILRILSRTSILPRLAGSMSMAAAILGGIGFCLLPSPLNWFGFGLMLVGSLISLCHRRLSCP
ncbi:hypothetical protein [Schlesneria sp. T3-172]|uniref:hypothetical protein n=1 Tax=Schlesneria sphaerica TaxID=3373610 RepID=UPI0037CAF6ED